MSMWLDELRKGLMEICVLNLLTRGKLSSHEIFQALERIEKLAVSDSKLYPLLVELQKDGKVAIHTEEGSASSAPRHFLSLTALGRRHMLEMDDYWDGLADDINLFLAEFRKETQ